MKTETNTSWLKMLDECLSSLNNRKLTAAIQSAQILAEQAEAAREYYIYASAQNIMGVSYVSAGNEMMAVDCYLKGLSCCMDHHIDALFPLFYINLGSRYQEANDHSTAIEYFLKAERALKHDACKADSRYHGWCLVNSMNLLISSIHQKDIFLGEKFLERCEALLTDEDANSSASISMLIIKCHLYWYMNRRDFVLEHIGELIGHLNLISPNDLVQSIQELIFLLKDMEDYSHFQQTLDFFRQYAAEQNTLYYKLLLCEFEMDYCKSINDMDQYHAFCIRHAELYMVHKQALLKERTESFTQKVLLQRKESERRAAERQSKIDALTGLGNRFLLKEDIQSRMEDARAKRGKLCIAIIDIDHFKTHNDTYGHIHGDSCLKLTATALMSCVGEKGRVYRFGGDEFVILLDSSELNSVKAIAEAIKQYFQSSDSEEVTDGIPGITLSQGYAISTVDSTTTKETLFSRADEALYSVKEGGRNNYCIYEE